MTPLLDEWVCVARVTYACAHTIYIAQMLTEWCRVRLVPPTSSDAAIVATSSEGDNSDSVSETVAEVGLYPMGPHLISRLLLA